MIPSLPHFENECQQSINEFYSCIVSNMSGTWSQTSIRKQLAVYIGRLARDILATASGTVTMYFIYNTTTKCSWAFYHPKTGKTMYINNNGHIVVWLPIMQCQEWLMLWWRSFSRWGKECFTLSLSNIGGQYYIYNCLLPITPEISQDPPQTILDALLMLIIRLGQGACLCLLWPVRWPIHPKITATYQSQYFVIDSSISECDDKQWNSKHTTGDWNGWV